MSTREQRIEKEKQCLKERYSRVLRKLTVDILLDKPEDVIQFIHDWAIRNRDDPMGLTNPHSDGHHFAQETEEYEAPEVSSEDASDEEEDQVDMNEFLAKSQAKQQNQGNKNRVSVSAEVYGTHNLKKAYVPKVVPKTDEQKAKIRNKLEGAFMFKLLEEKEKKIIIDVMKERRFKKDEFVIKQGDDGDDLFLVDEGQLECFKLIGGEKKFLLNYTPGMAFGELSLLYNTPRAANIVASSDCLLWSLDRECFNSIVKESSIKRRERFEDFMTKIELLQDLDPYERNKICDVLTSENFKDGQFIIKQGDVGDKFYFIEEGDAIATKEENGKTSQVFEYKKNDYFGELSLLEDQPRAANIIAKGDVKIASIDRDAFRRLLGPLESILKRNTQKYKKYVQKTI